MSDVKLNYRNEQPRSRRPAANNYNYSDVFIRLLKYLIHLVQSVVICSYKSKKRYYSNSFLQDLFTYDCAAMCGP